MRACQVGLGRTASPTQWVTKHMEFTILGSHGPDVLFRKWAWLLDDCTWEILSVESLRQTSQRDKRTCKSRKYKRDLSILVTYCDDIHFLGGTATRHAKKSLTYYGTSKLSFELVYWFLNYFQKFLEKPQDVKIYPGSRYPHWSKSFLRQYYFWHSRTSSPVDVIITLQVWPHFKI